MTVDKQKKKKKASSHDEAGYYLIFFLVNSYSSPKVLLFVPLRSSFLLSKVYLQISLSLISLIFWLALFIYLSTSLPCDRPMTAFYGLRFHVSFFSFFFFLFFFLFFFFFFDCEYYYITLIKLKCCKQLHQRPKQLLKNWGFL